jgi:hypothetical protein
MRPTANFTIHAILAACLVAFAASSAAADGSPVAATRFSLTLSGADINSGGNQGQHLEVHSYHWGAIPSGYKPDRVFVKSWSTSGHADAPPPSGSGRNEMKMDDSAGGSDPKESRTGHSMLGASEKVTVGGARTESRAEGKYLTLRPRRLDTPLTANGSLTVQASGGPCNVGARYPSITLTGGGKSYLLQDVQIADCGGGSAAGPTEEITFVYGKVRVRAWDPKKKEE